MMRNKTYACLCRFAALIFLGFACAGGTLSADAANSAGDFSTVYFPVLPYQASPDTTAELVPVLSNHPLTGDHRGLERVIVAIHDLTRDPRQILNDVVQLAGDYNSKTLVLAPQFYAETDIARYADNLPDDGKHFASWTLGGWAQGDESIPGPQRKPLSSFSVIDILLLYLSDTSAFPDLKRIVLVGHGEGGRFVQAYAATGRAPDALERQNIAVSYVVANAPAYLYFTPIRFKGGKEGFGLPDSVACQNYNVWPYGLDGLNPYAKHVGVNAIKLNYSTRRMSYLTGANLARSDPAPDGSCAAAAQGKDPLQRLAIYQLYLHNIFGDALGKNQKFSPVAKTGYDAKAALGSACGMAMLFGDGYCPDVPQQP